MVSLLVQHRTMETMLSILHCGHRFEALTQEIVLSRIANCELDSDEDALKFPWHMSHLQPPAVERAVCSARAWREITARGLWMLNGAISHKALGSMFVSLGGLPHVLSIANSYPNVVSHRYGCGLVLQQLCKSQLLHEVIAAGGDQLPQTMTTLQRLMENSSTDIKQGVASAYYCGLSFVPFLRQFDADNCIAGLAKELKLALGMQGNSAVLLPADQRPVEIDMFVNKNSHLINMYLRAMFVYLGSHLLQLGIVLLRRNRSIIGGGGADRLASLAGDSQFLPRDDNSLENIIAALNQPDELLEAQNIPSGEQLNTNGTGECLATSLISPEQWKPFRTLVDDHRMHELLLLIVHTFETHRKRDVRMSALNVLYVLSVAPCARIPIAECFIESPDSVDAFRSPAGTSPQKHRGMKVLLQVTEESDLTSKEGVLANVKALNVMALLMLPPLSVVSGHTLATFDRVTGAGGAVVAPAAAASSVADAAASYATICSLFRACDGVKTLLALKLPSADAGTDLSSMMPLHFHMFAAQAFIFSSLRYFGDTQQLFSVLGVRKLAVDLQHHFRQFRQQTATDAALEPLTVRTFMNNCLSLATGLTGQGKSSGEATNRRPNGDAEGVAAGFDAESQERQFVIEHAHLDYNKDSLLELIARHLQSEGLVQAADILRREADLPQAPAASLPRTTVAPPIATPTTVIPPSTPANRASEFPRGSSPLLVAPASRSSVAPTSQAPVPSAPTTTSASLDGIIRSYLRQTQEACPRPIATLPKIDLLRSEPVVGFDYSMGMEGPKMGYRGVTPQPTSLSNRLLNRKLGLDAWNKSIPLHARQIHRNRLPMYDLRNTSNDDFDIAVVDFCDFGESLVAGGTDGTIVIFSHLERGVIKETHYSSDDNEIMFMDISPDCSMFLVVNRDGDGKLLRRESLSSPSLINFATACAAVFSPTCAKIAATLETDDIQVLDTCTGGQLDLLTGMEGAAGNHLNVGVFDPTGTLVLNHGTLFDLRQPKRPVFRFDCMSEHFSGIFHPNGLQTVVDGNLWDLRTMSTVQSCAALLNSLPQYGRIGSHFYAPVINTEASRPLGIVNVVDSSTLSTVTTFQLDAHLETFALDVFSEASFATVNECADADKMLRVYQIGRHGEIQVAARQLTVPQSMEEDDDGDDILDDEEDEFDEDEEDDLFDINLDESDEEA
eukprot:GILJ01016824.1.p1 GENE.GILJ01016824.1~~GILJ01016824.1.p1  ORF type:complete len:1297 (+),score=198.38 GILJ01016824.1:343-3891(+)